MNDESEIRLIQKSYIRVQHRILRRNGKALFKTTTDINRRREWCYNQYTHKFYISYRNGYFEDPGDAAHYKLFWC